ncbi:MAG: serine protease [Minisyncoccia bacterium]
MEALTKTQLILLTLLISFVTSIATGIMTSSLLQSAPTNVTQTINRVVERSIERVSDSTGTKEVQIVSEDDRVISAIQKNQSSLVRIKQVIQDGTTAFYALGVITSKDGEILAEYTPNFSNQTLFSALFSDGTITNLAVQKVLPDFGVVVFKAAAVPASGVTVATFTKSMPKLGQTVIVLEGQSDNYTLVGRITNLQGESTTTPRTIETDFANSKGTSGAPLIDLTGDILGIRRSDVTSGNAFTFSQFFQKSIAR